MVKRRILKAISAAAVALALSVAPHAGSAQQYIQRHWVSGVEAKIVPVPVWITGFALGQVNEGTAVSVQFEATGADSYSVAGNLPSGLTLNASGLLSGPAPMVESSVDQAFSVVATNAGGSASRTFTLRVIDTSVPPPEWTTAAGNLGEFTEQTAVSIPLAASNGATFSIVSGALPGGLSISSSTGLISGTAPSVELNTDYSFTVRASNDGGQTDRAFTLRLIDIPSGKQVFASVGAASYTVPQGVTKIRIKAWGGGGAGGGKESNGMSGGSGGSGAFVNAVVNVTPGESLTVVVAGGGFNAPSPSVYAAGGGGGGASAVHNASKSALVVAAGGGGGGASIASNANGAAGGNAGSAGGSVASGGGGGGAGAVGGGGFGGSSNGGLPGSAGGSSGGNGGNTQAVTSGGSSSYSAGGSGGRDSGGGGGGAFAGGGGGYGTSAGGGGGGGASKITGGTGTVQLAGAGDPDWASSAGLGGGGASGTGKKNGGSGVNGRIVLIYGPDVN